MTTPAAGEQIGAPERMPSGCPVIHLDASAPLEAGSHWSKANELRETMERGGGAMMTLLSLPLAWEVRSVVVGQVKSAFAN